MIIADMKGWSAGKREVSKVHRPGCAAWAVTVSPGNRSLVIVVAGGDIQFLVAGPVRSQHIVSVSKIDAVQARPTDIVTTCLSLPAVARIRLLTACALTG